jgi:hypothetical protein
MELTLADRLNELTYHPLIQFGPLIGVKKDAKAFAIVQTKMIGLRMLLRKAKRFILDDEFIAASVEQSIKPPKVIAKYSELAYLPFPAVWIEYNGQVRNDTQYIYGTMKAQPEKIHRKCGFLLAREQALTDHPTWSASYVTQQHNGDAWIAPVQYRLRCPRLKETLGSTEELEAYTWGYSMQKLDKTIRITPEILNGLVTVERDPFFVIPYWKFLRKITPTLIQQSVDDGRGDMRWLVTTLQMINHVPVSYHYTPTIGSRAIKLRTIPFLDFSTVRIVAGAPRSIRLHGNLPTGIRHREHEVRGFNRVLHRGTPKEFTTWVKEHKRGDPLLGIVTHDYKVIRAHKEK